MYTKKNTRVTFRSNRRPNFKRNNFSINKPRNKGNITQQYNKYLKLAKEASSSGDRIQSEYYYQFTDHYYRLMLELGINIEENDLIEEKSSNETQEIENNNSITDDIKQEKKININKSEESSIEKSKSNDDLESIESIPFISKPAKKKAVRAKKESA